MKFNSKEIFTVPNILTYIRLVCVPFFIWVLLDRSIPHHIMIAFGIFFFASATDLADGYVARKFNQVSDIGKVIDPIADKLLQVSTIVCLAIIGNVHYAFVIILLGKELYMILGGAVILKGFKSDFVIEANLYGKLATLVNSLGILLAFFHVPEYRNLYYIDWGVLGVGCVLAIMAAANYTVSFIRYHKKEKSACDEDARRDEGNE